MPETSVLTSVLRRDRLLVTVGLSSIVLLSWLYILSGAGMNMQAMGDMAMPMTGMAMSPGHSALMLAMWVVMMAAMMLPSAAPVILLHATIARRRSHQRSALAANGMFMLGYVAVWAGFALAATTLQWTLDTAAMLSPMMATTSVTAAGAVLITAGLYQWTPLKEGCLRQCRSPLDFLLTNWREGPRGAYAMGMRHGLFCLGCCWMLMLLLFVGGVMNVAWIGGIALLVLVEKLAPGGQWVGRLVGVALVTWGGMTLTLLRH